MMSNFEHDHWQSADSDDMNNQFERFELLSAYLDGEVTAEERKQVQQWLDTDPQFHQLYVQLSRLQREIPTVPVPQSSVLPQQLSERVFETVDRQNRTRRLLRWGGVAIAAVMVGVISNVFLHKGTLSPRFANVTILPESTGIEGEPLTIALNRPVVEIPPSAR